MTNKIDYEDRCYVNATVHTYNYSEAYHFDGTLQEAIDAENNSSEYWMDPIYALCEYFDIDWQDNEKYPYPEDLADAVNEYLDEDHQI